MRQENSRPALGGTKSDYWYSMNILATAPGVVGVLLGAGYIVFALALAGLLVYLYRKDTDIQEILSSFSWAVYFPLLLFALGGLMAYFSSIFLYVVVVVVGLAFLVTAASHAQEIEFEKK